MSGPACYVVSAAEMHSVLETLLMLPFVVLVAWHVCRVVVEWPEWEMAIRVWLRRRRIRAIRAAATANGSRRNG